MEVLLLGLLAKLEPSLTADHTLAYTVLDSAVRINSHLLAPDPAIEFLWDALGGENHEALVGYVCGVQLYSRGPGGIQEFFRKHDATLLEWEAMIAAALPSAPSADAAAGP